ncbi:MAG: replication restart helicase PriA [Terriglobales bacterium]
MSALLTPHLPPATASFADVVLPVPLDQAFTYAVPAGLDPAPGCRVAVPWGARRLIGVVTARREALPDGVEPGQIKPLASVLDPVPILDEPLLELARWAAAYYQAPIGEMMRCALPPGHSAAPPRRRIYRLSGAATPGRRTAAQARVLELLASAGGEAEAAWLRRQVSASALATLLRHRALEQIETEAPPAPPAWSPRPRVEALNSSQQRALAAIDADGGAPILLHGVTGSGKTAVYLAAIENALSLGLGALMLVPEIGLTPALFADFEHAFPGLVAVLHSGLRPAERAQHWRRLHSGVARVAIGTRSAVFAPVAHLGLILVDEEHDASYKQQESPRYHGRDLAVMRAKLARARIVLGSATPSLESFTHARAGKYRLVEMTERVERRPLPAIRVVDMGAEFRNRASPPARSRLAEETIFSAELRTALEQRLSRGQQSLLLINRRGFAPVALCRSCGTAMMCRDCALALSFHKRAAKMICHLCGYAAEPPRICAACASEHIYFLGSGSEKAEEELAALFPAARIARLDRDTARQRRHFERVLAEFRAGRWDILIGTQMIAKGHDVPGVTLVGVLQADLGLAFPDFRAAERTFQLLTQVAGRAGRGAEPGEVVLQVMHPEHYAVDTAARADFAAFYAKEANFRHWMHYPPFAALAAVQLRHRDFDRVLDYATEAGRFLERQAGRFPAVRILGPAPALVARVKREHRYQFLFKSASRRELAALLHSLRAFARDRRFPATALIVDVDPLGL